MTSAETSTAMSVTEDDGYGNSSSNCNCTSSGSKRLATEEATPIAKTPPGRIDVSVLDHAVHSSPPPSRHNLEKTNHFGVTGTPMSTCSTATNTTATTLTSSTFATERAESKAPYPNFARRSSSLASSSSSCSRQSSSIHGIPLPSPSRSRLDRQYAKRLAASSVVFRHGSTARSPVSVSQDGSGITRSLDCDSSMIFRPKSILSKIDAGSNSSTGRSPRRFLFPPSPTKESPSSNIGKSHSNTTFLRSSNSNASVSQYSTTSSTGTSHSNSSSTSLSSSRRRRNSNLSASMDLGISDRFVPSRATSNLQNVNLWGSMNSSASQTGASSSPSSPSRRSQADADTRGDGGSNTINTGTDETSNTAGSVNPATGRVNETSSITTQQNLHNVLLRSELLGENISPYSYAAAAAGSSYGSRPSGSSVPLRDGMNRLRFHSPRQAYRDTIYDGTMGPTSVVNSFSLTPFGNSSSQQLMAAPQKHRRKIAKVPFKVLDAPALQDDFYLNLVDWSSQNVLAVGLGHCVYLWSACTSKVTKLCDLTFAEDVVTSVSWAQRGTHLAVGTNKGEVQLWDTIKEKKVRTMKGHTARVGTLAWSGPTLASGSRDRLIFLRDVRDKSDFTRRLNAHRQEVCGLKWSYDEPAFLASGGNDNQLHVVDSRNPSAPVHRFTDHTAAVKAIAWSPHQHGLLASGGGTADRCIRFWNTLSGSALNCVDTGSQVCNLAWSQNCNEIVSTHGYSLNQIVVWRYPSLSKVVTLTGHTYRVLYLAMSPDGSTIVTGAGDETLRFWQVFPGPRSDAKNNAGGLLFPNTLGSVIR
ncbi:unnamed protein product [Pseudo-nitzschia multistriata]|uniref:CDC20/Fizzy WD40 domain-containing protein n=1 Tax=Pseudo-nitzschia multistriata TaxID=183589 RepID=A0A448Z678_9STRA|nr:unnamed protein product [Pseudo-nitzschia multistriata]